MNTDELILALQGEHELEYELLSELISVLEKIKDTEDDEEIKVIKKVVIFIKKTYDSGRETYILPEELEYLNDLYLQEEVSEETPENVVEEDISEELAYAIAITQQTPEQLTEKFKSDTRYKNKLAAIKKAKKKKAEDITTNKKKLSDDIKKSNKQIAKLEKELLQLRLLLIVPAKEKKEKPVVEDSNFEGSFPSFIYILNFRISLLSTFFEIRQMFVCFRC